MIFGFGFLLALIAGLGLLTWQSVQSFERTARQVADSQEVLERQEGVLRHLMDLEAALRGYLLTGDDRYVRDYEQAQSQIVSNYDALKNMVADQAEATALLDKVRAVLSRTFQLHDAEIAVLRMEGPQKAAALFLKNAVEKPVSELEVAFDEFEKKQRVELQKRQRRTRILGTTTSIAIVAGTGLAALVLLVAGWQIYRDVTARQLAETALANQANLLSSIIDTIPDFVYVKNLKGEFILNNRAHRLYLGEAFAQSVAGKHDADFFPQDVAARAAVDEARIIETGTPLLDCEEPGKPGTRWQWLETNKVPLRDIEGQTLGIVGVSVDITARKAAEEKLQRLAADLERSNAELQNFASVASHDLQEPLRKIITFADRLRTKSAAHLDEQGLDYLGRMDNAAKRMQTLIQDLLKLSRITSKAQPFVACDLAQIVGEVLGDLEVAIEQRKARIETDGLPTLDADPLQMRQLFQNLIANAIKFQRPDVPPVVTIRAAVRPAMGAEIHGTQPGEPLVEITLQDNGIGFDQKFAEQIFVVFQRLHTREQYEGTGIGLAVCRKITDRHGGKIVAVSEEGAGAKFIITLPLQQPKPTNE